MAEMQMISFSVENSLSSFQWYIQENSKYLI